MIEPEAQAPIYIGISSCLLGEEVRYDGSHKHNGYITRTLGEYFEFVPFCPEVAIGLGVPRPPIRLVRTEQGIRARGVKDPELDVTDSLAAYAAQAGEQMTHVSGYLLKRASPSCGMERVKVYTEAGMPVDTDSGIYARALMDQWPELPVEEEGRLMDPVLRENFIERVFVYHRWQQLQAQGITAKSLVEFHTQHKFSLLSHSEPVYRQLGRLIAEAGKDGIEQRAAQYIHSLMQAFKKPATRKTHSNVLNHLAGFLKTELDGEDRRELAEIIDNYRRGLVPLIVPITLLKHHFRRHPHPYVLEQHYLSPHPQELMLRNSL